MKLGFKRPEISKCRFYGKTVAAALDTNVLLAAGSVHDLLDEYETLNVGHEPIPVGVDAPKGPMRREHAKDAMLLVEHLWKRARTVYFLREEFIRIMTRAVPPGAEGEFSTIYARVFAHAVLDVLWPDWRTVSEGADAGLVGNACDRLLVGHASRMGVPLITFEAKPMGAIRVAAAKAGVKVVSPRDFWSKKDTEDDLIAATLQRWQANKQKIWALARPMFLSDPGYAAATTARPRPPRNRKAIRGASDAA